MFIEKITGGFEDKRRWWRYKARTKALPPRYRTAIEALERYLMYAGGISDGNLAATMFEDLAELFETSAADGTPIRAIVGEDPAEFVETFLANYAGGQWINRERDRLNKAIEAAEREGDPT